MKQQVRIYESKNLCAIVVGLMIAATTFGLPQNTFGLTYQHENTYSEMPAEIKETNSEIKPYTEIHNIFSIFDTGPNAKLGDDYPYDIGTIKNMTLQDLNWTEQDIDEKPDGIARSYLTVPDPDTGVNETLTIIEGTFGGDKMLGGDNYTMIPRDELMAGRITLKTIHAKHGAVLILPDNYSKPSCKGRGFGLFANTHDIPSGSNSTDATKMLVLLLVSKFDTPVLLAGEHKDNWEAFGYSSQDGILYPSILAILLRNEYSADAMKMTYMYELVRTNLLAHTLFERLLEQEGGFAKGKALEKGLLSEGGSKQGYARWLVGILDDRVTVLQADYCQVEDLSGSTEFFYKDWGVPPIRNSSAGDWANFSNQVATILISLGEGMKAGATIPSSPGVLAHDIWDIYPQRHMLKPKFISITGDIGGGEYKSATDYDLLHDGTYFVLGQESRFLRELPANIEWRYGRVQTRHALGFTADVPYSESRLINNIISAIELTLNLTPSRWPKVESVTYTLENKSETERYFNVSARLKYARPGTNVSLWYAGNSDRRWNDPEHTGMPYAPDSYRYQDYKWKRVRMYSTNGITFNASVIIKSKLMYGYYVESELPGTVFPVLGQSKMFDASPVAFIQEYKWEATGASDLYISNVELSNPNPKPGEKIWVNTTMNATRLYIWFEDENKTTREKVGHYPSPPLVNIESALYVNDVLTPSTTTSTIVYSTELSLQWTVPRTPGIYRLAVRIDYNNNLPEQNELNNTRELLLRVGPDLKLENPDVPASIFEGDEVLINATVSLTNAQQSLSPQLALLIDNITKEVVTITVTTTVTYSFSWRAVAGRHEIRVVVDPNNQIAEMDENNNCASVVRDVLLKPGPDVWLSPSDIALFPRLPTAGDTVLINATVHSRNLTLAADITVGLLVDDMMYAEKNVAVNNTDVVVMFRWTAGAGTHTLRIKLDTKNVLSEANEYNNDATIVVTVRPAQLRPDIWLTSADLAVSTLNPIEGSTVYINVTVHSINLSSEVSIAVELRCDNTIVKTKYVLVNNTDRSVTFGWGAAGVGTHELSIIVDATNNVTELNENNNRVSVSVTVKASRPPTPGFEILVFAAAMCCAVTLIRRFSTNRTKFRNNFARR